MPKIDNPYALESCFVSWQNKLVKRDASLNHPLRPKHLTSDRYSLMYDLLPYRERLDQSQIYTRNSRKKYVGHLKSILSKLPSQSTLQIRWHISKEVPAFSVDFLYQYLSRFGKLEALYQMATNAVLAVFRTEQTARVVLNNREIGFPYGRLYVKLWNPLPQDVDYYRVMKHVEKAAETKARFDFLMDKEDRLAASLPATGLSRIIAESYKMSGPTLATYLRAGVKITETIHPPLGMIRPKPRLHLIKKKEEYDLILKESGKLIVVYFFATWCGPCKKIAPYIEQLLSQYEHLVFAKINIEDNLELAESENVAALPTFHFYKDGVKLREMVGANNEHLKELIESFI